MSGEYQRPQAAAGGLRLHLNENTSGCSPRVLDALQALTGEDVAFYPEYDGVVAATAQYLSVPADRLLLTNGLDEGILATSVFAVRTALTEGTGIPESVVVLPAFDMYAVCTNAVGGRVVEVPPRSDFAFPLDEVLRAITPSTRVVYITSPNNPTGVRVRVEDIDRVCAAVPPGARVFVDEAYHDFCGDTALPLVPTRPNLVIGRTFAKAHGLAALRAGCVVAQAGTLQPLRGIVPPYSLNVCAAAAMIAAFQDRQRVAWYVEQVRRSRELVYGFCRRFELPYWESGANFVLVRTGVRTAALVQGLAARGIAVRDRSRDAGCDGCMRITAGVVQHTERCLTELEELLCAAE